MRQQDPAYQLTPSVFNSAAEKILTVDLSAREAHGRRMGNGFGRPKSVVFSRNSGHPNSFVQWPSKAVAGMVGLGRPTYKIKRPLVLRPRYSVGINSSAMTCSNFEMQSLFMLVCLSWASDLSDSCKLFGSRTVITRVGSLFSA